MHKSYKQSISALNWLWLSAIIFVVDQLAKRLVVQHLIPGEVVRWTPFFNMRLAYNPGAAFSFLGNASGWQRMFLSVLTVCVVIFLVEWLRREGRNSFLLALSLSLIIGGAIGNLYDRIHLGVVVDFFDFHINNWHFATFNVADAAISVGVVLLLMSILFKKS